MYNMFRNNENLLNELAIDHNFNSRSRTKSLKLPKKTEKGRRSVLYSGVKLVSSHALDIFNLPLEAFKGAGRLALGKSIRLTLFGECVSVMGYPPREGEFVEQDHANSSLGLSGNPFVLVMSLTTS